MFARKISIHLKPNTLTEFSKTFDQQVVPLLRKQQGFKDEIIFATPGATDVLAISLWDNKQDAEAYGASTYKDILKMLENFIEGDTEGRGDRGSVLDTLSGQSGCASRSLS